MDFSQILCYIISIMAVELFRTGTIKSFIDYEQLFEAQAGVIVGELSATSDDNRSSRPDHVALPYSENTLIYSSILQAPARFFSDVMYSEGINDPSYGAILRGMVLGRVLLRRIDPSQGAIPDTKIIQKYSDETSEQSAKIFDITSQYRAARPQLHEAVDLYTPELCRPEHLDGTTAAASFILWQSEEIRYQQHIDQQVANAKVEFAEINPDDLELLWQLDQEL
jgi:hypothetical protein